MSCVQCRPANALAGDTICLVGPPEAAGARVFAEHAVAWNAAGWCVRDWCSARLRDSLPQLLWADAIALLPGWRWDNDAVVLALVAQELGLSIFDSESGKELTHDESLSLSVEVSTT